MSNRRRRVLQLVTYNATGVVTYPENVREDLNLSLQRPQLRVLPLAVFEGGPQPVQRLLQTRRLSVILPGSTQHGRDSALFRVGEQLEARLLNDGLSACGGGDGDGEGAGRGRRPVRVGGAGGVAGGGAEQAEAVASQLGGAE